MGRSGSTIEQPARHPGGIMAEHQDHPLDKLNHPSEAESEVQPPPVNTTGLDPATAALTGMDPEAVEQAEE
jgi:hypothetical protein